MTAPLMGVLAEVPLIAVVRHQNTEVAREIAFAAVRGGIRAIEITATVPDADVLLAQLRRDLADDIVPSVVLGAGTVLDPRAVDRFADAGAEFLVSPGFSRDVIDCGLSRQLQVVPGVMTATEACAAVRHGCTVLKLFPADTVGVSHLRALAAVLPTAGFVPTGGVGLDNLGAWLRAGALAAGVGSCLTTAHERDGPAAVTALSAQLVTMATATTNPVPRTTPLEERPR